MTVTFCVIDQTWSIRFWPSAILDPAMMITPLTRQLGRVVAARAAGAERAGVHGRGGARSWRWVAGWAATGPSPSLPFARRHEARGSVTMPPARC